MAAGAGTDQRPGLPEVVQAGGPVLTDGGIETRFLFHTRIGLHPDLGVATLAGDPVGEPALRSVYDGYVAAAAGEGIPLIIGTPTFRASRRYTERAGLPDDDAVRRLNANAVAFLMDVRAASSEPVWIAGVLGPAGDAYLPGEALDARAGRAYHAEQAMALAGAGADLLFAPTFPSVEEAVGVSHAMAATGRPHVVSFVLGRDGRVLDGTPLADAIARVDDASAPLFHSLSCIHTSVAARALEGLTPGRLLEVKANASDLPPDELVALDHPVGDEPIPFADEMVELRERFGLAVVGGCCGTDDRHMRALAGRLRASWRPGPPTA